MAADTDRSDRRGGGGPLGAARRTRDAWRRLSPLFTASGGDLVLLSVVADEPGAAEAVLLAMIATTAAALAEEADVVPVDLGPVSVTARVSVLFAVALVLCLVRAALQLWLAYLPAAMSATAMATLRRRLFDAFTRTSWQVQSAERDGHFQSLMITHVNSTAQAIVAVGSGISGTALFLTLVVAAFALDVGTALIIVGASVGLFALLRPAARRLRSSAAALSAENVEYSKVVQEVVLLAEETQVFGVSEAYRGGFYRAVDAVRRPLLRTRFLSTATPALFQSVALLLLVLALLVVSVAGSGSIAGLGAIVLILVRALSFAQQLQQALANVDQLSPFMTRLADAIALYESDPRVDGQTPLGPVRSLALQHVSFRYAGGPLVLDDVDVEVRRGEALGVVGPSGAGKSSMVQLLLRLRQPSDGRLLVNGGDARDVSLEDWQRRVAHVPQTSQLVHGTVAENIRFYRPWITDEQVVQAARRAHVHDDVVSWAHGYDTVVGQRAAAVSGGQRQRICLARAMAGGPDVIVLDEPTSALDMQSEHLVQETLQELKRDAVLFLVAHRLSTLAVCDRVLVLVDGRVDGLGTPEELAQRNAFFREAQQLTRRPSVDGDPVS